MSASDPITAFDAFVARVDRLERRERALVAALVVALLLAALPTVLLALQSRRPDALDARELVLRDSGGRIRARLGVREERPGGASVVQLLDPSGNVVTALEASDKGASLLRFLGPDGRSQAELVTDDSGPALTFFNEQGSPRAWIGILGDQPALELIDASGAPRASLHIAEDQPRLEFFDADGHGVERANAAVPTGTRRVQREQREPLFDSEDFGPGSGEAEIQSVPIQRSRTYPPGTLG
jgi:hypothetical protein